MRDTIEIQTAEAVDVAYGLCKAIELLDDMNSKGMLNLRRQARLKEITGAGLKFHKVMQEALADRPAWADIKDHLAGKSTKSPTTLASEASSDIQA